MAWLSLSAIENTSKSFTNPSSYPLRIYTSSTPELSSLPTWKLSTSLKIVSPASSTSPRIVCSSLSTSTVYPLSNSRTSTHFNSSLLPTTISLTRTSVACLIPSPSFDVSISATTDSATSKKLSTHWASYLISEFWWLSITLFRCCQSTTRTSLTISPLRISMGSNTSRRNQSQNHPKNLLTRRKNRKRSSPRRRILKKGENQRRRALLPKLPRWKLSPLQSKES